MVWAGEHYGQEIHMAVLALWDTAVFSVHGSALTPVQVDIAKPFKSNTSSKKQ